MDRGEKVMNTQHIPVLCDKVVEFLRPKPGSVYIDGTIGLGGHSATILETSAPDGRVIGIDLDLEALAVAEDRLHVFGERYSLINGNFAEMDVLLERHSVHAVDGILLDLGVSSLQLDTPHRGFSFSHTGPLDMRMNSRQPSAVSCQPSVLSAQQETSKLMTERFPKETALIVDNHSESRKPKVTQVQEAAPTAMQVVNDSPMNVLVDIFKRYGEERFAKRIADRVVRARQQVPITTTTQFAEIVKQAVPRKASKIHPATRVFQALRVHVNAELENLEVGLDAAVSLLKPGGYLCVITFHSLEDRIVKHRFQTWARTCICSPKTPVCICEHSPSVEILTKRPVLPDAAEVQQNPRARSAKLRAVCKL